MKKQTQFQKQKSRLRNQKGMALVETLPILVIFLVMIAYMLGMFGVVHTGILNSISARAYAFETFRNRANLTYFRDQGGNATDHFANIGVRFHTVNSETMGDSASAPDGQYATTRPLAIGRKPAENKASASDHNTKVFELKTRNRIGGVEASPAWIMTGYGICINAQCGDKGN